ALLTGIKGVTQIGKHPAAADTLKINLGVPPTPVGQQSRFGVLGGDNAGFPNGRRLADDSTDIELRVFGGFLLGKKLPLGDGVDFAPVSGSGGAAVPAHARTTDEQIAALQAVVRSHPRDAGSYVLLGDAYLQKVRETGDAEYYTRSQGVLERARRLGPRYSA